MSLVPHDHNHAGGCVFYHQPHDGLTCQGYNVKGKMREFDGGATRNDDADKFDYEAFLSPAVIQRYAAYMHSQRKQADGKLRDGDNWQKGIPKNSYMKSMWRHFMDVWMMHRQVGDDWEPGDLEDSLCALLFNVMGYLFEEMEGR